MRRSRTVVEALRGDHRGLESSGEGYPAVSCKARALSGVTAMGNRARANKEGLSSFLVFVLASTIGFRVIFDLDKSPHLLREKACAKNRGSIVRER